MTLGPARRQKDGRGTTTGGTVVTKDKTKAARQTMTIGAAHQQKGGRIQAGGQASRKKNPQDENGFADPLELYMTRKMPKNAASFT